MKYAPDIYAKALSEVWLGAKTKDTRARIVKNFLAIVRKNGDLGILKKIAAATEKKLREKTGARKVTIETARPLTRDLREEVRRRFKDSDTMEEKITPELVAGMRITLNDELELDGSFKRKLIRLFQKETH